MDYGRNLKGIWDTSKKGRSQNQRSEDDDLLVFGYSCKLFRDDEKALYIDSGQHLIPWMGDCNLMIDRFDVRGALYDLMEAESRGRPFAESATEAEVKEEEVCDEERYLALYYDESEQQFYQEEEMKRLQMELTSEDSYYKQVEFTYGIPGQDESLQCAAYQMDQSYQAPEPDHSSYPSQEFSSYNPSIDDELFIPPPQLNVPPGIEVPASVKQNKIIVKTAKFIFSQGAQMEIVIKTKQAGNPMFNFLSFDNPLNAYYKHVVQMIRNGRYRWEDEAVSQPEESDQYLHPNLSQSVRPDLTPGTVASPSIPSPHCAYSNLIVKIREKQIASSVFEDLATSATSATSSPVGDKSITNSHLDDRNVRVEPRISLVDYPSANAAADGGSDVDESDSSFTRKGSSKGSENKSVTHDYSHIKWPHPEMQMVIDKMASYIIKNGPAFEDVVRSRGDTRFKFLTKGNEYYPYYQCKLELYSEVYGDIFKSHSRGGRSISEGQKKGLSSEKNKKENSKNGRVISFSIKSREQEVSVTSHTTFPVESSTSEDDEEIDEEEKEKRNQERLKRRLQRKAKAEKEKKEREEYFKNERVKREEVERRKLEEDSSGNEDLYDIFKYAQEMEREMTRRDHSPPSSLKKEERKRKAAAFLSKIKDATESKSVFGPQLPPELTVPVTTTPSATQSPSSSRGSSEGRDRPPPLPPPLDQPPPPPPKSPSPLGFADALNTSNFLMKKLKTGGFQSKERSSSPAGGIGHTKEGVPSLASSLLPGLDDLELLRRPCLSEPMDKLAHKGRSSHKKRTRLRSRSRSPSSHRDRKKRKRSHVKRKKHRSRSPSASSHNKAHRISHKKKMKQSSQKERSGRKRKHRRHHSSSASSLPSSDSTPISSPSSLPSESQTDPDVQVIEYGDDSKGNSRGSSVVSLPPVATVNPDSKSNGVKSALAKSEGSGSGGDENALPSLPPVKTFPLLHGGEKTPTFSDSPLEMDKKSSFNPNTSSAMAKIAEGLRAKLNAMLEQDTKPN